MSKSTTPMLPGINADQRDRVESLKTKKLIDETLATATNINILKQAISALDLYNPTMTREIGDQQLDQVNVRNALYNELTHSIHELEALVDKAKT